MAASHFYIILGGLWKGKAAEESQLRALALNIQESLEETCACFAAELSYSSQSNLTKRSPADGISKAVFTKHRWVTRQ